jgi:hypothetical protein
MRLDQEFEPQRFGRPVEAVGARRIAAYRKAAAEERND